MPPFDLGPDDQTDGGPASPESSEIIDNMPEPQQHAIDAAASDDVAAQQEVSNASGQTDDSGEVWNAAIHATGKDGGGVKTVKGLWRRRKGTGSGPRTASKVYKPADNSASEAAAKTQEIAIASARASGVAIATSMFMIGRAFGGEAWAPTPEEVAANNEAWSAYCLAKGIHDFPPGIAVCIVTLAYVGPRLFIPETKKRVGTIKQWFAVRVAKYRVKKELKKRGVKAHVSIEGAAGVNPYASILVNGKPYELKAEPQ